MLRKPKLNVKINKKKQLSSRYNLSATHSYYQAYNANHLHSHNQFSSHLNSTMLDTASTFSHHVTNQPQQYFASCAMSASRSTSPFPRKL